MFWSSQGVGGVRRVIDAKRAALLQRGWRHTLLAPGVRGPGRVDCGGWPLPYSGGYRVVTSRRRAQQLVERCQPDLVEAADPYTLAGALAEAARALQVPAVAFCHSDLSGLVRSWLGGDGPLARAAERRARRYLASLYGRFDLVLAPSRELTERLREMGVHHAQHQPLGVDCRVFRPEALDRPWRRALLARMGLPPQTRLVAYAGRFAAEKRLPLLAQAVARLGPGHVLIAMGAGPCPPPELPSVRLLPPGRPAEVARLLASCDVFAHAGDQETFGLAALEAMACGTALVVSSRAGLGELATGVGTTVGSTQAGEWADALHGALHATSDTHRTLALARAHLHDWPRIVDSLTHHYLHLLGKEHSADRGGPARPSRRRLSHA